MMDILRACSGLASLDIALDKVRDGEDDDEEDEDNEDDRDEYRVSFDSLYDTAPRLDVISLRSIELWDLECLLNCQHVTIRTDMQLSREWLMRNYMALPFDKRPKPSRYMESLRIQLEYARPGTSNCFVIAQFLLCVINKRTVVKIFACAPEKGKPHDYMTTWHRAQEISETLSLLRQIRACEEPSTPGYRHVGSSGHSSSRQSTHKTV